jgi:hypothetical protein
MNSAFIQGYDFLEWYPGFSSDILLKACSLFF